MNHSSHLAIVAASRQLLTHLERGQRLDAALVRTAMEQAFGGSDAAGRWDWKTAYDAGEAAAVLFMLKFGRALLAKADTPTAMLPMINRLAGMFPTHTRRSEESVQLQQFSTTLPLAFVATSAAGITGRDVVLEPSAGTGLLAVHAQIAGAHLVLNELADGRAGLLRQLFPAASTFQEDASHIHDLLPRGILPSVVIMNPPFTAKAAGGKAGDVAIRHIQSALARLAPGGRLVAIIGENQGPGHSAWTDDYRLMQETATIILSAGIAGRLYASHGTTFATRLLVIDKSPASDPSVFPESPGTANDLDTLLGWISQIPHRLPCQPATGDDKRPIQPDLVSPKPVRQVSAFQIDPAGVPLHYDLITDRTYSVARADAVWEPYRLQSIQFPGAADHPDDLVQSAAMAAVPLPIPSYKPLVLADTLSARRLSAPQLETLVYAGEAHSQHLGRWWTVSEGFERLIPADMATPGAVQYRRGFFLGDGTGTGKGRQGGAIILDNWLRGRRRAVWISRTDTLLEDARRDWAALGMEPLLIRPQWHFRAGTDIALDEGVLFTTFPTLRSQESGQKSRLQQVIDWCGPGFDGVILFDEAHMMKNAVGDEEAEKEASLQGRAGLRLQHALPDARIVYASATAGSVVQNFCYAQRLGMWGSDDFRFATRDEFMNAVEEGGVAAMEVLARDLRALGLYTSRSLSFAGVEFEPLVHQLTADQIRIYDAYAHSFVYIHNNLTRALEATGILCEGKTRNRRALGAARSAFESVKQRFFSHLLLGMTMPSLLAAMEQDIAEGRSPVIQLVSTGEALTERRLALIPPEHWDDLDIDITPREYVLDYLQHSFPTQLYMEQKGEGDEIRMVPVFRDGQPVICREAEARRDQLIEGLAALPPVPGALDQLIQHFGTDIIAEVTGRRRRIVRRDGVLKVENRSGRANLAEVDAFMSGRKLALVFSDAGGTGRSYHADLACANQRRRVHYALELGWRADNAVQGPGRSHRTFQRVAPIFRPVATDVAAQKRFISYIARDMEGMGALTRGQRQTGGQGIVSSNDNLESAYARDALRHFFQMIVKGQVDGCPLERFEWMTGLRLTDSNGVLDVLPPLHTFLNRLLALPIALQNMLFTAFHELLTARVEGAMAAGVYDLGLEMLTAHSFTITERHTIHVHQSTGAETQLLTIRQLQRTSARSVEDALSWLAFGACQLAVNAVSGRAAVIAPAHRVMTHDGQLMTRVRLIRPTAEDYLTSAQLDESSWKPATIDEFRLQWEAEVASLPEFHSSDLHIVTGLLLPVWRMLPSNSRRVYRLATDDGSQIIGRQVPAEWAAKHRSIAIQIDPDHAWAAAQAGNASLSLADSHQLRRTRHMGDHRLELSGWTDHDLASLKALGLVTEIVNWRTRLFVPIDQRMVFDRLIERHPIVSMESLRRAA